ncbi:hypothetical protein J4458_05645 [Candidatus Woesearchaeota archaeon]|nr:hypothetical protein [Candidatus Woesearchaeota archaeon]
MADSKFSFLVMNIVLLIAFIGLANIVFGLHRLFFAAEFLFLGIMMLVALVSMFSIHNDIKFGWTLMSFSLFLILMDLLFIYLLKKPQSGLLLPAAVSGLIGFLISVMNIQGEEAGRESGKKTGSVRKEFKPGKYIASKTGKKFHSPKCDWAKKVKKQNAVWFNTKEEAQKAGYKADDCV